MLNGIFDHLLFWHWWIFAIVLLILEIFTPGAFFMWMGVAAGVTGFTLLAMPEMSWEWQFILFSISSIVAIVAGRFLFNRKEVNVEDPTLGEFEHSLIGKVVSVEQAIQNGSGRVKVGESTWKASGPDCNAGNSVRVIRVNGSELIVEPV